MELTECPCCGWGGFKTAPATEDDAVLSCEWCTTNLLGEPNFCSRAKEIVESRENGTYEQAS